ncbi:hypothetical protein HK405_005532 [Cladochytrium tenue]|nr:hypothetical protein HK405_005532 [Cladochytrium tenue]
MEQFFKKLGVRELTAVDIYNKLKDEQLLPDDAKETLKLFSSLLASPGDKSAQGLKPEAILEREVFPVRLASGGIKLCAEKSSTFVISDLNWLAEGFEGKLDFLNFPKEEVKSDLEAFIRWTGLEKNYLTRVAKKEVIVKNRGFTAHINDKERDIKSIAIAYKSPRATDQDSLHDLLRQAETLEADDVTEVYSVGVTAYEPPNSVAVDMVEDVDSLKFYMPKDSGRQALCFSSALPEKLATWLLSKPGEEQSSDPGAKPKGLNDVATVVREVLQLRPTQWRSALGRHDIVLIDKDGADEQETENVEAGEGGMGTTITYAVTEPEISDERKAEIGRKGEQYVFDILSGFNLPDFGEHNWMSKNNRYALYDYEYEDKHGVFRAWLGQQGAFASASRPSALAAVTYHIEVKTTTTKDCSMPMYLSRDQFKEMCRLARPAEGEWKDVYVILRVFAVESDSPQLKALADPVSWIGRGELSAFNTVLLSC